MSDVGDGERNAGDYCMTSPVRLKQPRSILQRVWSSRGDPAFHQQTFSENLLRARAMLGIGDTNPAPQSPVSNVRDVQKRWQSGTMLHRVSQRCLGALAPKERLPRRGCTSGPREGIMNSP